MYVLVSALARLILSRSTTQLPILSGSDGFTFARRTPLDSHGLTNYPFIGYDRVAFGTLAFSLFHRTNYILTVEFSFAGTVVAIPIMECTESASSQYKQTTGARSPKSRQVFLHVRK